MPDVLTLAAKLRAALDAGNADAIKRLVTAYQNLYRRLEGDIDALTLAIGNLESPKESQVVRLGQYSRLRDDLWDEMDKYQGFLDFELRSTVEDALELGARDAKLLVEEMLAGNDVVVTGFRTLNPEVIKTVLGFFDPEGPLYKRLSQYSSLSVERVAQAILNGVGLGQGPKVIAKNITRALGMSLTDAMRMTRTVQIYSYREANRASYIANSDVVKGWIWNSALIPGRTCMSCVKMHGTEHPLSEPLNDHYNGLCTMLPLTIGSANPVKEGGEEWFNKQSEATQRAMMGNKYQAWKEGKFDFEQLSTTRPDDVFGEMRTETPLKDLIVL